MTQVSISKYNLPVSGSSISVVGLGKSGTSAAALLARNGYKVYASDSNMNPGETVIKNAEALTSLGVEVQLGGHDLARIERSACLVVSPGIDPKIELMRRAKDAGVPVISEIEVALNFLPGQRYIAITGTNGKTTTTALVAHLLRALGQSAVAAGNIGTPLAEVALSEEKPDWVSLELSSFQLHDTPSIKPQVGVLLNLSPDHLDRYSTLEEYYADKLLMFRNADERSEWILNGDDFTIQALVKDIPGTHRQFTVAPGEEGTRSDAFYARASNQLVVYREGILPRIELPLLGTHNAANALAATLAVMTADPAFRTQESIERIAEGLRTFTALPNRLESAGEFGGVEFINDSKATNVSSTFVAITGMLSPTILLLGGKHKGESYSLLSQAISDHVKHVVAYGEAADIIETDLRSLAIPVTKLDRVDYEKDSSNPSSIGYFENVIATAFKLASPGDTILLSPACSSFDMFKNYEERGAEFKRLAKQIGMMSQATGSKK